MSYGFLNAKRYWLVLLLGLRRFQIDVLALVLYAVIPGRVHGLGYIIWKRVMPRYFLHHTFSDAMFHHHLCTVHLPGPYNEGHRHHHYLADATPFDARMHGTGMPEEGKPSERRVEPDVSLARYLPSTASRRSSG